MALTFGLFGRSEVEFDLSADEAKLIVSVLCDDAPDPMSYDQRELTWRLADLIRHCSEVGTTLHINC